jgi:L-aminopeptidase/D-esterase-like protein
MKHSASVIGITAALALTGPMRDAAVSTQERVPKAQQALAPTGGSGLTAVHGLKVGHYTMPGRPTGCTVVLVEGEGAVGGVSQRGGAPATRELDVLNPMNMVDRVNGIVLSGGSAFGLESANGVMRYLEERNIGYKVRTGVVPIVPAASLIDLSFGGDPKIRPNAECGYKAAEAAATGPVGEGNVGAGAGATIGKMVMGRSMKAGIGSAAIALPDGLVVGAVIAVNAVGDIIDPSSGQTVAGIRTEDGKALADVRKLLRTGALMRPASAPRPGEATTIGVVATNARFSKADVARIALMADDGLARAIVPSHTTGDGDTVFALATGRWTGDVSVTIVGALAAEAMAEAIVRAATQAQSSNGIPSARELGTVPARLK